MSGYRLAIDYAFSNYTILENVHRFTFRFQFGAKPKLREVPLPSPPEPIIPDTTGQAERETEKLKQEAEVKARREAEARARQLAEERARQEAEEAAKATLKPVTFEFAKADLTPESREAVAFNVEVLKRYTNWTIIIEGHCDERGSNEFNIVLGQRRADAVKNTFIEFGLDPSRISTISYGEERPVDSGHNEGAWVKNRRVVLIIE